MVVPVRYGPTRVRSTARANAQGSTSAAARSNQPPCGGVRSTHRIAAWLSTTAMPHAASRPTTRAAPAPTCPSSASASRTRPPLISTAVSTPSTGRPKSPAFTSSGVLSPLATSATPSATIAAATPAGIRARNRRSSRPASTKTRQAGTRNTPSGPAVTASGARWAATSPPRATAQVTAAGKRSSQRYATAIRNSTETNQNAENGRTAALPP